MVRNLCITLLILVVSLGGCSDESQQADPQQTENGERLGAYNLKTESTFNAHDFSRISTNISRISGVDMKTIVALGDSLTAGFGVDLSESYPALLEKALQDNGYQYKVINAGVSGETSSGTLGRVEWILTQNPDVVIVETGANDGLRGVATTLLEKNLCEIVALLQEANVEVLLTGMRMVWNLGPVYVAQFNAVYPRVAEEMAVELMPFFLEGVATNSTLNMADGLHPNSDGYRVIVENIYPYVVKAIDSVNR
ncbi:MAG: arylesterase [Desulfotalea sp.]|nr:MAG: arylesterase [Desulfotalea sp.]